MKRKIMANKKGFLAGSLFLLAVIIISISTIMYMQFRSVLLREATENYNRQLMQLHSSLSTLVQYVNDAISQISYDADLQDYLMYAEKGDLIRIYRINKRIEALVTFQEGIDSIHVYYKDEKKVMSFFRGLIDASDFNDQQALVYSEDYFLKPGWTRPRTIQEDVFYRENFRKGLTVLRPFQGNPVQNSNTFLVVNLNWKYIEDLALRLGFGSDRLVFFRSPEGDVIPFVPVEEKFLNDVSEKDYLTLRYPTSFDGEFVSYVAKSELTAGVRPTMIILIGLSGAAIITAIILFLFISAPMLQAYDGLAVMFQAHDFDEVVRNALKMLTEKESATQSLIDESNEPYSDLVRILTPGISEADALSILSERNIHFDFKTDFGCIVFEIRNDSACGDEKQLITSATERLKLMKPDGHICLPVYYMARTPGYQQLAVIAALEPGEDLTKLADDLYVILQTGCIQKRSVFCGISFPHMGFGSLFECFANAFDALQYHFQYPDKRLLVYSLEMKTGSLISKLPDSIPVLSQGSLSVTGLEEFKREINHLVDSLETGPCLYPENIKFTLMQLLQDLGKSVPASWNFGVETGVFDIINSEDLEEASQVILHYCDRLITIIDEKGNDPGSLIVEKAKSYIMANLDQDLTTQRIGDEVFMSRSYLSRLFYMKTGVMLKDFIIEARVNKACQLLKQPDLQIQEIGNSVGYSNNQSFTRVFKEKTGMSPGDYRRRLSVDADVCRAAGT